MPTRYLLNDACVFSKKPLVSGAALRLEGHVTVYHHNDGPCYRCIFPQPPPPETVTDCSNGGVLGAVPGVIGCLQALEVIKIIVGFGEPLSQKMVMFDASSSLFRMIKMRYYNSGDILSTLDQDKKIVQFVEKVQLLKNPSIMSSFVKPKLPIRFKFVISNKNHSLQPRSFYQMKTTSQEKTLRLLSTKTKNIFFSM